MSFNKLSKKLNRQTEETQTASRAANGLVSISKAAKFLSVSPDTLRNWETQKKLIPERTSGGARRYLLSQLIAYKKFLNPLPQTPIGQLSVSKAARELLVSPDTIRNWDKKGIIKAERTKGGSRRFSRTEIKRLQEELSIKTDHNQSNIFKPYSAQTQPNLVLAQDKLVLAQDPLVYLPNVEPEGYSDESENIQSFRSKSPISLFLGALLFFAIVGALLTVSLSNKDNQKLSKILHKIPFVSSLVQKPESVNNQLTQAPSLPSLLRSVSGEVLAESSPSGSFLEINLDTVVNGLLSAKEASVSGALSVNNVTYNFPDVQGDALTFLQDDGGGNLTWTNVPQPGISTTTTTGIASFSDSFFTVSNAGAVGIKSGGITTTEILNGTIANSDLASSSITISPGSGMSGGGAVSLGGSVTLTSVLGSTVNLTSEVEGVLPIANGGSNKALTLVAGGVLYTDADSYEVTAAGSSGQVLISAGSGTPTWGSVSSSCSNCVLTNPSSTQTITPTAAAAIGLSVAQASSGSVDIFNVTNNGGGTKYLYVDSSGNTTIVGSTNNTGTFTSSSTLIASSGFTMTTGALSLTSTSGAISSTGLTALTYTLSSGTAAITAPTLNLNTSSTGNTAIGNATGTFALTSSGGLNVTTAGVLSGITGYTQSSGAFSATLTTTNKATFASTTANSDTIQIQPQSGTAVATFNGIITSSELTVSDKTWTFPNTSGTVAVSATSPVTLSVLGDIGCSTCLVSGGSLWTAGATSGTTTQTVSQGGTLTFTAGTDITTTGSAGVITIADSSTLATVTGRGATTTTLVNLDGGIAVDTSNFTVSGSTGAISTVSTLNVDSSSTLNAVTIDANANFAMSSGTGTFTQNSTATGGGDFSIVNTGIATAGTIAALTANSLTTGDVLTISATAASSGTLLTLTGPSGGTAGVTDAALKVASDVGNIGTSNGLISSTATIDSTTNAISGVNLYLSTVSSQALATTVGQTYYGIYNNLAKTGADTTSGTVTSYGVYSTASNTGGDTTGTRNTYAGYFSATGDGSGATNAYGVYAAATGADNNYGVYINSATGTGINIANTGITTDISLQNAETIDNDTDGTINFAVSAASALKIGSTGISSIGNVAHTIVDSSGALAIDSATTGAINIGTGSNAKTITVGNNTTTSALAFTSGTGSQTHTSSIVSGTTTTSAFVMNASALTTGTALYVTSSASSGKTVDINATQTSGTIFNLAYGAAKTLSGDLTGLYVDLNSGNVDATNQNLTGVNFKIPTVTNTQTTTTKTLTGMLVNFGSGAGINQNGAGGTLEFIAGDFQMPALTQSAGTLNAYGTKVTTPATITTGGTAYGEYISATGVGAGTLYGVGISNITGSGGTEYAFNVAGTGWDAVLRVGSTTVINGSGVTQVVGGGTGLATVTQNGVLYGNAASTLGVTAEGATGQVLIGTTGGAPSWGTISGSTCTNCLINNPSSDQSIAPTGQATTGLQVRQTSTASPTDDIFQITDSAGSTKYFYVDKDGNVSTGAISNTTLTLTPTTNTTALTLVGTNVTSAKNQYINTKNSSGTIFDLSYGAAQTLAGTVIAQNIDLSTNVTATNQSETGLAITLAAATNTSGTQNYKGLVVTGGSFNSNTGNTALNYYGADITIPALTQTAGTLTAYGANITTPSSITTGGTAYGLNVAASGVGAGTLYGANIGAITGGSGTEVGLQIGSGWDTNLLFNDTTTRVAVADGGVITILDSAGNSLCTVTDNGTTGTLNCTGNITAGGGTVGAWSDDGTTLTPANANRKVSIPTANTTGADLAITNTGIYTGTGLVALTANSATSGDILTISATSASSGTLLTLTGPSGGTAGVTDAALKITSDVGNIGTSNGLILSTATFDGSSATGVNLYLSSSDAIASANTDYGIYNTVTNTGAIDSAIIKNSYGSYTSVSSTLGAPTTAGTTNVYGEYITTTATHAANFGTVNNYGLYVANGTSSTNGTSTKYGINIDDQSGADTNIDLNFTASPIVRIGDAGVLTFTEAGGNNTLCTLTDSANKGDLTCTGNITGSSSGTVGFWTRTSTTLSPATANDIVSIATTNTTGADLAITNTGIYTGTGIVNLTANSAIAGTLALISDSAIMTTTGNLLTLTANAATSTTGLLTQNATGLVDGYAHLINVAGSTTLTTGGALNIDGPTGAATMNATTGLINISSTGAITNTTAGAGSGTLFQVTGNGAITPTLASISDTSIMTTTGKLLDLTANAATTTTGLLTMNATGLNSGYAMNLNVNGTTTLTSGGALNIVGPTSTAALSGTAGGLVSINAAGIYTSTNNAGLLNINATSTTAGVVQNIEADALTTGQALRISNASAALTTGSLLLVTTASTGAINTNGVVSFQETAAFTSTSNNGFVNILANSTLTGTIVNISGTSITTGAALNIAGSTSTGVTGSTSGLVNIASDVGSGTTAGNLLYLAPDFSAAGATGSFGIYINATDSTSSGNNNQSIRSLLTMTGDAAKVGLGINAQVTTSSTTADTIYTGQFAGSATGAISAGTRTIRGLFVNPASTANSTAGTLDLYGSYITPSSTLGSTGVTDTLTNNVYGTYISNTATVDNDCTTNCAINSYGVYVANGTSSTNGTSTKYGIYVESPTGADTNYAAIFAGGNIGIGDTTPDALLDIDSTSTTGLDFLITNTGVGLSGTVATVTANSYTTGDIFSLNGTGLTTGKALNITGPSSTGVTSGTTSGFVKLASDVGSAGTEGSLLYLAPDFSAGSATTGSGIKIAATDSTGIGNTDYGINSTLTLTGNGAKTAYGMYQTVTDTSTTADTVRGIDVLVDHNGASASGTKTIQGIRAIVTNDGITDAGTINVYGGVFSATGNTGGTQSVTGIYTEALGGDTGYGIYIVDGTATTDWGVYQAGATDENYFAAGVFVGLNTSLNYKFQVDQSNANQWIAGFNNSGSTAQASFGVRISAGNNTATTSYMDFTDANYGTVRGSITQNGTNTLYNATSDRRLKQDIVDTHFGLDDLLNVQIRDFKFIDDPQQRLANGYIAQELYDVYPDAVTLPATPEGVWMVDYGRLTPLIIAGVQELNTKVDNIQIANALLIVGQDGYIQMDKVKMDKLVVNSDINTQGTVSASNFSLDASTINRVGALASVPVSTENKVSVADAFNAISSQQSAISQQVLGLESKQASDSATLAEVQQLSNRAIEQSNSLDDKVASTSANLASLSQQIQDLLNQTSGSSDSSNLTPPSELTATGSATLAKLNVTETFSTLDATVSGTLKSLGESFLGKTTIAGDLSVDGTFSITEGKSINAFPTLYIQNFPLAQAVDFFNGLITLNKEGVLTAKEIVTDKISVTDKSAGKGKILAGQTEAIVLNKFVTPDSIVIITPETVTSQVLSVIDKVAQESFKVKIPTPAPADINFSYLIIGQKQAQN